MDERVAILIMLGITLPLILGSTVVGSILACRRARRAWALVLVFFLPLIAVLLFSALVFVFNTSETIADKLLNVLAGGLIGGFFASLIAVPVGAIYLVLMALRKAPQVSVPEPPRPLEEVPD